MTSALTSTEHVAHADLLLLASRQLASPRSPGAPPRGVNPHDAVRELAACARCPDLCDALCAVDAELCASNPRTLVMELARLFDGAVACPINETAYDRRDKGVIIADVCGFYNAFGFEPREGVGEKPDHLITELEFAALLLLMLAQAVEEDDSDRIEITAHAWRAFFEEHLGPWWPAFTARLAATAGLPILRSIAALHESLIAHIADRYGFAVAPLLSADTPADEGAPYECDFSEAAPVVPLHVSRAAAGVPEVRP